MDNLYGALTLREEAGGCYLCDDAPCTAACPYGVDAARALRSQAQAAQRSADQEQARADSLSGEASAADQRSAVAQRSLGNAQAPAALRSVPFVNTSGQSTGLLLHAVA